MVAAAVLAAVLTGLARLGVGVPWGGTLASSHGPLFVLGAFCTVIGLERAVALAQSWSFAAPALGAASCVALLGGLAWASWLATASSGALALVNVVIVRRQSAPFTWLMLLGAVVLTAGNVAWASGRPIYDVITTWIGFFVLTIAAERLELSRLAPTPRWASRLLVVLAAIVAISALAHVVGDRLASRVLGGSLALLASWQLRFDLSRRTLRQPGLPRFAATGVLLGAGWLLGSGLLLAASELARVGPRYDAALHGVFVGFVLSMVFAHAPIILPAVARVKVPFHVALYAPLALLHLGLLARVAGDLAGISALRQAGGLGNAIALPLFLAAVLCARWAATRR